MSQQAAPKHAPHARQRADVIAAGQSAPSASTQPAPTEQGAEAVSQVFDLYIVQHQKDMFVNEADAEGAKAEAAREISDGHHLDVPGHKRGKRGRKPLDPALPREVVRHELPEGERVCPHDGAALREIGVEVSEQLDICRSRCG